MVKFYVGLHHPCDAGRFKRSMISINAIRKRKGQFPAREWILDSGAFTEISTHGRYRDEVDVYAGQIRRWWSNGLLIAAVSQDYMCEPFILDKTGLSVDDHQRLTIDRYDMLRPLVWPYVYIMPVLQGYWPDEYVDHIRQYGQRLKKKFVGRCRVCMQAKLACRRNRASPHGN